MSRRRPSFALLVVLALTVVGCADDPVPARGGELRVTLDEYRITPQNVSARAGALRVVARNSGRLNHNLRVEIPRESPGERERTVGGTPTARPNSTVTGTVVLAPGTYRLACTISNHDDLGMWGELTVSER